MMLFPFPLISLLLLLVVIVAHVVFGHKDDKKDFVGQIWPPAHYRVVLINFEQLNKCGDKKLMEKAFDTSHLELTLEGSKPRRTVEREIKLLKNAAFDEQKALEHCLRHFYVTDTDSQGAFQLPLWRVESLKIGKWNVPFSEKETTLPAKYGDELFITVLPLEEKKVDTSQHTAHGQLDRSLSMPIARSHGQLGRSLSMPIARSHGQLDRSPSLRLIPSARKNIPVQTVLMVHENDKFMRSYSVSSTDANTTGGTADQASTSTQKVGGSETIKDRIKDRTKMITKNKVETVFYHDQSQLEPILEGMMIRWFTSPKWPEQAEDSFFLPVYFRKLIMAAAHEASARSILAMIGERLAKHSRFESWHEKVQRMPAMLSLLGPFCSVDFEFRQQVQLLDMRNWRKVCPGIILLVKNAKNIDLLQIRRMIKANMIDGIASAEKENEQSSSQQTMASS